MKKLSQNQEQEFIAEKFNTFVKIF